MTSLKKIMTVIMTLGFCMSMLPSEDRPLVEIILVSEGNPGASIVVTQEPTPVIRLSVLEIQYYIREITGAILPIRMDREKITGNRILVGKSK